MTKLVQISTPVFSITLRQCHIGCRLGQVLKIFRMLEYILKNLKTDFKHKKKNSQYVSLPQSYR